MNAAGITSHDVTLVVVSAFVLAVVLPWTGVALHAFFAQRRGN